MAKRKSTAPHLTAQSHLNYKIAKADAERFGKCFVMKHAFENSQKVMAVSLSGYRYWRRRARQEVRSPLDLTAQLAVAKLQVYRAAVRSRAIAARGIISESILDQIEPQDQGE